MVVTRSATKAAPQQKSTRLLETPPKVFTEARTNGRKKNSASFDVKADSHGSTWANTHGAGEHEGAWGIKGSAGVALSYGGIFLLMFGCPGFAIYMWYALTKLDGSALRFAQLVREGGVRVLYDIWPRPSGEAWAHVVCFGLLQAAFQLFVPGPEFRGPVSPKGNVPIYKSNGVPSYVFTLLAFFVGHRQGFFDPARVYDLFGEILAALNYFSLAFCLFLYLKGRYAPSTADSGTTGSLPYDFYWGMELYPRLGRRFDLKTWTNCRMGMMGWAVLILCYAFKQHQLLGYVSPGLWVTVALMQIYIFKFFWWESGYWTSMDIAHDRAGYYICWGCLVWVPAIYTSPALYLVEHAVPWPRSLTAAVLLAGAASIYINYDADRQRQVFRATNGKTLVWWKPPRIINAHYITGDGQRKTSLLLASGWWGLARHFHYVPEILGALFWTLPVSTTNLLPYFYVIFLTLLLTDRAFRDDARCSAKYGAYWNQYRSIVPYRMVPGLF
eukprot:jgi/Botrbrau1/6140/Bobra.331_2s0033.1